MIHSMILAFAAIRIVAATDIPRPRYAVTAGSRAHGPVLPRPTGAYHIGTSVYQVVDSTRLDRIAPQPRRYRTIPVQLWYPTTRRTGKHAAYIPDAAVLRAMQASGYYDVDRATLASWSQIDTHALLDATPIRSTPQPLIIFSHGQGVARSNYTALVEDLVSHGYVIAAIDHPYGGFTATDDGRVLTSAADTAGGDSDPAEARRVDDWARDASLVISRLTSASGEPALARRSLQPRLDPLRVGMMGHSLGGAAAFEMCRRDARIRACINMDGAMFGAVVDSGIGRPVLMMRSRPDYSDADLARRGRTRAQWDAMGASIKASIDSILTRRQDAPAYVVSILGTGHMSYSDAPFVMPSTITRFGGKPIAPLRNYQIISAYSLAFLDRYVRGTGGAILDRSSPFPEVSIERFGHDTAHGQSITMRPGRE